MSAQKNSSYSDSVERRPDLLWARSQLLLSWLSHPWTRFFCQLPAPRFLLLPCGGSVVLASPHPGCSPVCHPYSICAAMDTTAFPASLPLWGLKKSLTGDKVQFAAKWSSCSCSRQMYWSTRDHTQVFHSNLMAFFLWSWGRLERHKNSYN